MLVTVYPVLNSDLVAGSAASWSHKSNLVKNAISARCDTIASNPESELSNNNSNLGSAK